MRINPIVLWFLCASVWLAPQSALGQCDPKVKACKSFIELAKAGDTEASKADLACFYKGKTPSGNEDEFFILVDEKMSAVSGGAHPAVFMADFKEGQTVGLRGYGPMTKEEALSLSKATIESGTCDTFDENSARKQISEVSYGDEKTLQWVDTTTIKKSTLRFQRTVEFPDENRRYSLEFTGHCYRIAPTAKH